MFRCPVCNKKLKLTDIKCKCEKIFCSLHRYPSMHDCSFNFKLLDRDILEKNNPKIVLDKVIKF